MSASTDLRRGWCPDMLRPMETADGLLVRIHPRRAVLSASQARTIAETARRFGNGLLDLSSRGNLQIRGVTPDGHPHLAEILISAGLLDGVRDESPFRLTTVSPLAGIDPLERLDASILAEEIEEAGRSISGLHPKLSVLIDGGGAFPLDDIPADLRIVALDATSAALGVARPGRHRWVGVLKIGDIPTTICAMLSEGARAAPGLRFRDISDGQLGHLLQDLPLGTPKNPPPRAQASRVDFVATLGNIAFFLAPPYGRYHANGLSEVAAWSEEFGNGEIRLSPFKSLAIPFVPDEAEGPLKLLAHEAGFIVEATDPRLAISTCPGREGCTRGTTSTHEDADLVAASIARLPVGLSLHISGCAKGCAHPRPADLTLVGDEGAYQVVFEGTARDKPVGRADIATMAARLAACSQRSDLMRVFGTGQP